MRFRWPVNLRVTHRPRIVGTSSSVISLVVVHGINPYRRWPGVSPGIIRYSFTDTVGRMDFWLDGVRLLLWGYRVICWYDFYEISNPGHSYGSTIFTHYSTNIGTYKQVLESKLRRYASIGSYAAGGSAIKIFFTFLAGCCQAWQVIINKKILNIKKIKINAGFM